MIGWLSLAFALMTIPSLWRALVAPDISNQYFHQQFLLYGILWALAVYAAVSGSSWYQKFFELEIWRFLGRIQFQRLPAALSAYPADRPVCTRA